MLQSNVSIKFKDREVESPLLRVLFGAIMAAGWLLAGLYAVFLAVVMIIVVTIVIVPLHFVLRLLGRNGFIHASPSGPLVITIRFGNDAFRKQKHQ